MTRTGGGMRPGCSIRSGVVVRALAAALLLIGGACAPAGAAALPGFNNIYVSVANDAGAKYDTFGNGTYFIRFEGIDRGLNALHISTDPALNFGQVTVTGERAGTFYATDSGGKGYEDEIILMVAVNGTIPDDFRLRISSDGYTWTPNPLSNQPPPAGTPVYQPAALDEVFSGADFMYGPQIWKPTGNETIYPLFAGQDMNDAGNTFRLMFVDLNSGVLRPNTSLENMGAVRINYTVEHPAPFMAFNVYGYCKNSNNGEEMIAWSNALVPPKAMSGYSVTAAPEKPLVPLPGFTAPPGDPDGDGLYEDQNANGMTDYDDVVVMYRNIEWIGENEPAGLFDFDGDNEVGFNDVVVLFGEL